MNAPLLVTASGVLLWALTLCVVLLALLAVGLLRSHAEILRRLDGAPAASQSAAPARRGAHTGVPAANPSLPPPPEGAARRTPQVAPDVSGITPEGDAAKIAVSGTGTSTLLAFLSTSCTACVSFWEGLGPAEPELAGGPRVVAVTKDPDRESPSRLRELAAGAAVPVVMSSLAWEEYAAQGSPYFVLVGPDGTVAGEGTAAGWPQLESLLRDALLDAGPAPDGAPREAPRGGGVERQRRAEAELMAARITPDHPSLYPEAASRGPGGNGEQA
jgi:hypothetical protein